MQISIKYCNNIDEGNFIVEPDRLNIKYGFNGSGKSTLAKAVLYKVHTEERLLDLIPYKSRVPNNGEKPEVDGLEGVNKVILYDETYVDNFVFLKDEVLKDSFDVFIKTPEYDSYLNDIQEQIKDLETLFQDNPDLSELLTITNRFLNAFGTAKIGYAKSGILYKGVVQGNKLRKIPDGLEKYSEYIKESPVTVKWIKWQTNGTDFSTGKRLCPYCAEDIEKTRDSINQVGQVYDSGQIDNLIKTLEMIEELKKYFCPETYERLQTILGNPNPPDEENMNYLVNVKAEVEILHGQLLAIQNIGFVSLKNVEKVIEELVGRKIAPDQFIHLKSAEILEKATLVNNSIEKIIEHANLLQGAVNKQKSNINRTVQKYKDDINDFLKYAGFQYQADFTEKADGKLQLILNSLGTNYSLTENTKEHLSFGERNAFSLVLFMFDAIRRNPDIIILDDPISSFDSNKRFALLNRLFLGPKGKCFTGMTVLLLTHDFSILIDTIYNFKQEFHDPAAYYLQNKHGILEEKPIKRSDFKSFPVIFDEVKKSDKNVLCKMVALRRYLELINGHEVCWHLISSLFKKRDSPTLKTSDSSRNLTEEEVSKAEGFIREQLGMDFHYLEVLNQITEQSSLLAWYHSASSNYEKLQLYRMLVENKEENSVIIKFINETYHIENDYLFQLDPYNFDTVPEYIIDECNKEIERIELTAV